MRTRDKTFIAITSVGVAFLVGKISSMIFVILLARLITVSDYGTFQAILAVSSLSSIFVTSGATIYTARMMSRRLKDPKEIATVVDTSVIIQILFFLAAILILILLGQFSLGVLILLSGIVAFEYSISLLRGLNLFRTTALFQMVTAFFKLGILAILGYGLGLQLDLITIIILYSFAVIPSIIIVMGTFRKGPRLPRHFSTKSIREGLYFSIPAMMLSVAHYSTTSLAVPVVNSAFGSVEASYISVAFTFGTMLSFIPSAINFVIMPTVAGMVDRTKVVQSLKFYSIITALISGIVLIGFLLLPNLVIGIIFSSDYGGAAKYFPLILGGYFFLAITTVFDAVWVGVGDLRIPFITNGVGAIINLTWIVTAIYTSQDSIQIGWAFFSSRFIMFILMIFITMKLSHTLLSKD